MTDQQNQENQPTAANSEQPAAPLIINTQYLKDLSFESPNAPAIFVDMKQSPDVSVNLDVKASNIKDNLFRVSLLISAEARYKDKVAFICESEFCAIATINVSPEHLEPVLLVEVPKFLFPSAREIIATTTRNGGFMPLLLNPIDFMALYINKKQQQPGAAPATPANEDKKKED